MISSIVLTTQNDQMDSDEVLVSRVLEGNQAAFCQLVQRHGLRYRALATRIVADSALAEDLVQEAFVKLWTYPHRFDAAKSKFTTWFHRVVVNRCLDEKRKRKPEALPEGFDKADPALSAEMALVQAGTNHKVSSAVDYLSERQKLAITLSYFDGLSNRDAATVMDLNIKAYESLLVRARATLRHVLVAEKDELLVALG